MKPRSKLLADFGRESLLDVVPRLTEIFLEEGEIRAFGGNEVVVMQGSLPTHLFIPLTENLKLIYKAEGVQDRLLGYLQKHRSLGLQEIFQNKPYSFSAVTETTTTVACLAAEKFLECVKRQPEVENYLRLITSSSGIRSAKNFLTERKVDGAELFSFFDCIPLEEKIQAAGSDIKFDIPGLWFIKNGTLNVLNKNEQGYESETTLGEGAFFGGQALVPPFRYNYQATATTELRYHFVTLEKIGSVLKKLDLTEAFYAEPWLQKGKEEDSSIGLSGSITEIPGQSIDFETLQKFGVSIDASRFRKAQSDADSILSVVADIALIKGLKINLASVQNHLINSKKATPLKIAESLEVYGLTTKLIAANSESLSRQSLPAIVNVGSRSCLLLAYEQKIGAYVLDSIKGLLLIAPDDWTRVWDGQLLEVISTETDQQIKPKEEKSSNSKSKEENWVKLIFKKIFWNFKPVIVNVIFLSILSFIFGLLLPLFTQNIFDEVLSLRDLPMMWVYITGFILATAASILVTYFKQRALAEFSVRYDQQLSVLFYRHALGLPASHYSDTKVGDILSRLREIANIRQFLSGSSISAVINVLAIVIYSAVLFFYSWKVALVAISLLPLTLAVRWIFRQQIKQNYTNVFESDTVSQSHLTEQISSIATIKATGAENFMRHRWELAYLKGVRARCEIQKTSSIQQSLLGFLTRVIKLGGIWFACELALEGEVSTGGIMAISMYLDQVISPIGGIAAIFSEIEQVKVAYQKLAEIFETPLEETAISAQTTHSLTLKGKIRFERVSFRYSETSPWVLKDLTFTIYPDQVVAVVGRSGCGKTTLAKLISGTLKPTTGRIFFDDFESTFLSLFSLRSQMGFIMQNNELFSGTIGDNIAYGDDTPEQEEIEIAADRASATSFITNFPTGFNQYLAEGGLGLSGGQKQRVSMARTLYRNPKVLIMDEATSALDAESERAIMENMKEILKNKTALIIAHRLSTIRQADRILVMREGSIIEEGSHSDLIRRDGHYTELFENQAGAGQS